MGKLFTPQAILSGFQTTNSLNDNFDNIEAAFDACLSRTGETPNQMETDIDLNSNDIFNVSTLSTDTILVDGEEIPSLSDVVDVYEDTKVARDAAQQSAVDSQQSADDAAQSASDAEGFAIAAKQTGMISAFAMPTAPTGWLVCDGAEIDRTTYADLFSLIGETWGAGNGMTTFNKPDLREDFLRGAGGSWTVGESFIDDIKGHTHTGTTEADGGHTPSGTVGSDGSHSHTLDTGTVAGTGAYSLVDDQTSSGTATTSTDGAHTHGLVMDPVADHTHTFTTGSTGGTETRPRGAVVQWCIKY